MQTFTYHRILRTNDVTRTYITTNITPDLIGLKIPDEVIMGIVSDMELLYLYGLDFKFGEKMFPFDILVTLTHDSHCITNYKFDGNVRVVKFPFRRDIVDIRGNIVISNS